MRRLPGLRRTAAASAAFAVALGLGFGAGALFAAQPADLVAERSDLGGPLAIAAEDLAARLTPDGAGIRWEVVQDQVVATADGKSELIVSAVSRGYAKGTTFVQELRHSTDPTKLGDFDAAATDFRTVISADAVWRDEGDGYFTTGRARIPGLGVDPFTLTRWSELLRRLAGVKDLGTEDVDGQQLHHYSGTADAADWPGIVAADGLAFTATPIAVDLWLDGNDRLVRLAGLTQNLAETDVTLLIKTTVTLSTEVPAVMDQPLPLLVGSPEPKP